MFNDFKTANYPNSLVSPELYARHLSRMLTGDVVDGLTVTPGSGLQVVLQPGNTLVRYGTTNVASARLVSLVNTFNLTIATADASNPRIDAVVVYIDNSVTLASNTADGQGAAKAMVVAGTPNASPVAPNAAAIQAAVGASNPYTVVANVRVNAGVSVISTGNITDVRSLAVRPSKAAFSAYPSASQTISAGAFTQLQCNTEEYDIGSCFDVITYRYIARVPGLHHFDGACALGGTGDTNRMFVTLYKNGSAFKRGSRVHASTTDTIASNVSADMNLALNDYVELFVWQNSGGTKTTANDPIQTYFNGHLVGGV